MLRKSLAVILFALFIQTFLTPASAMAQQQKDPRINSAQIYIQNSEYKNAIKILEKVVKGSSGNVDVQFLLGLAYKGDGQMEKAVTHFKKALAIMPGSAMIAVQLASTHLEMNDSDNARRVLEGAIKRDPKSALAHYAMGVLYYNLQDPQKAPALFWRNPGPSEKLPCRPLEHGNNLL